MTLQTTIYQPFNSLSPKERRRYKEESDLQYDRGTGEMYHATERNQRRFRLEVYRYLKKHLPVNQASIAATAIARQEHQGIGPNLSEKPSVARAEEHMQSFHVFASAA